MVCILCLEDHSSALENNQIEIFSEEGLQLNVCGIITKHFWLRPNSDENRVQTICLPCWKAIKDFHQFYQHIAEVHKHLELMKGVVPIEVEDDPLPQEVELKVENLSNSGSVLQTTITDNFFDSEVKVEVNDLDFLPQVEVIEDVPSDRAQRANRRSQTKESSESKVVINSKRIKLEPSSSVNNLNDDESELPLAVFIKTDANEDAAEIASIDEDAKPNDIIATEAQKRRRGRPRKAKETSSSLNTSLAEIDVIKVEHGYIEGNIDEISVNTPGEFVSGTDDTADSSSGSCSDDSLPDAEPQERYAEIPKRVVVKPKKYRKRPKPLVPPRRLTREEINKKNELQAEYDRAIAQFFEKFTCPKCSLLVQNFGEMRRHFRVSHNDEPGYMTCCGRKFHQRKALAEHVYVHWNPEYFKCKTCNRLFQDARALEVHDQTHISKPESKEKKVFQCDKCPKAFTTKAAFEYHSYSKHVPKSEFKFTCKECNKKLPTERKLKDHTKYMHDPESAIICDKCGKQMRSQSNLKKHHQMEHSDIPRPPPVPMQCEICGTWLRHLAGLKQHMKTIHEDSGGEHRCPICNKTSTNARALKRHIYHNHECERKFKCTMCEKAFKRPQDLREHTSTHTGEVLYTCPNCPMTFFSNANMYKHRQRLHRAEWEADKKKPVPPNIMQQAVGATAAMKMQQAVGATSAFFAHKLATQVPIQSNVPTTTH